MATQRIIIDPITRIEGHLRVDVDVQDGQVVDAFAAGEMFRGFERILRGRHPNDAQHITQRICGVCPASHAHAATLNLDSAYGVTPPTNGRLIRNLILGANYIQSHILHFYHLTALDFVDVTALASYSGGSASLRKLRDWVIDGLERGKAGEPVAVGPFLPRYEGDYYIKDDALNVELVAHYLQALEMRRKAHEMLTLWGGRMPHEIAIAPGGATQQPSVDRILSYRTRLLELQQFVQNVYVPDVLAVAGLFPELAANGVSYGNFLSYGVFEETNDGSKRFLPAGVVRNWKLEKFDHSKITEQVRFSRYSSATNRYPHQGATDPEPAKAGAYTWLKAPRYAGRPMEVGPAARLAVAYLAGQPQVKAEVDAALAKLNAKVDVLNSTAGRHLARALECKLVAAKLFEFVDQIKPSEPFITACNVPDKAEGMGLTEAPRGALGHWIVVRGGKIDNYQAVVPTTWNASPRDDGAKLGPIEQSLLGLKVADVKNPMEPARVVRAFDPCIACAVHTLEAGREVAAVRVS